MNDMAKVTWSAAGQAVELPEGYRFDGDTVRITREGDRVVLEPIGDMVVEWSDEELQRLAQEGLDSGPDEPFDMDAILREARVRFAMENTR